MVARLLARQGRVRRQDRASLLQMQVYVALQVKGEAEIGPGRKNHHASTRSCRGVDGAVYCVGIQCFAVAGGTEFAHIECSG